MDNDSSSASRVKAFRSRMAGQFKRVEAYVTESEKAGIDQVKQELGVTTDIAVAGLVRLGLERYREEQAAALAASTSSVHLAQHAVCGASASGGLTAGALSLAAGPVLFAASAVPMVDAAPPHSKSAPVARALRTAPPRKLAASLSAPETAPVTNGATVAPSPISSNDVADNPIARFFKNRKEMTQ